MKALFVILTLAFVNQVKASDFISLPIRCSKVSVSSPTESGDANVQVAIVSRGSVILGTLQDGNDRANLHCKRVATDISSIHNIECRGVWNSDGSEASLSATLNTYVPLITIQRSNAGFGAQEIDGMCLN